MDTKVDWLIWKQLKLACNNNNNQLLLAMNELNKYLNLFARIYFKIHKLSLKDLWSHCIITPINIIKITLQNVPKKEKPSIWQLSYSKNQISSKVTITSILFVSTSKADSMFSKNSNYREIWRNIISRFFNQKRLNSRNFPRVSLTEHREKFYPIQRLVPSRTNRAELIWPRSRVTSAFSINPWTYVRAPDDFLRPSKDYGDY